MDMGRTIDFKYLRPHVESSVTVFLNEIFSHCSSSISHWLEDLTEGFNRFEKDKVSLNIILIKIKLNYLYIIFLYIKTRFNLYRDIISLNVACINNEYDSYSIFKYI